MQISLVIHSSNLVTEKLKIILVIKQSNLVIFEFVLVIYSFNLVMIKLFGCLHFLVIGHWKVVIRYLIWWWINWINWKPKINNSSQNVIQPSSQTQPPQNPQFCQIISYQISPKFVTSYTLHKCLGWFLLFVAASQFQMSIFHQQFTQSFYARWSQEHKKILTTWLNFYAFGICACKSFE